MRLRFCLTAAIVAAALLACHAEAKESEGIGDLLSARTRAMVFAPHPDDESLGAGGLLQRVLRLGGGVKVVFMTNGDGFPEGVELLDQISHPSAKDYRDYGDERRLEALHATASLGIPERDVVFLGFPDGGLSYLLKVFRSDAHNYQSSFTLETHPPLSEILVPRTDYNGHDLRKEIRKLLADFQPNLLVVPAPHDEHPDHRATYHFVLQALGGLGRKPKPLKPHIVMYLVHFGQWPVGQGAGTGSTLGPPEGFPGGRVQWVSLALTPMEAQNKRRAILEHSSQMLVMGRFLLSFARGNELFMTAR